MKNNNKDVDISNQSQPKAFNNVEDIDKISHVIQSGFAYYFQDAYNKVVLLCEDMYENEFWTNPYTYGNSIGHLVLHIIGNLSYYIGAVRGFH